MTFPLKTFAIPEDTSFPMNISIEGPCTPGTISVFNYMTTSTPPAWISYLENSLSSTQQFELLSNINLGGSNMISYLGEL